MLVSNCCNQAVTVESNNECSYYICTKCRRPTDGRCSFSLGDSEDANIQSEITR